MLTCSCVAGSVCSERSGEPFVGFFFYFEEEEFCAESNAPSFIPRVLFAFDVYLLEAPVEGVV